MADVQKTTVNLFDWWGAFNAALGREATLGEVSLHIWWGLTPEAAARRVISIERAADSLFREEVYV